MDPDEALKNARAALKSLRESLESPAFSYGHDATEKLVDAFESLDDWLSKGGLAPAGWRKYITLVVDYETGVIDAVRTWVNADCGAAEADALIASLAALEDAAYDADAAKKKGNKSK